MVAGARDLRFMCCFRFKLWWMTQRMGKCGKDVPLETQFMIVESKDGTAEGEPDGALTIYTVFLPLLEGQFRAVLQGNEKNEIEICLESGELILIMKVPRFPCVTGPLYVGRHLSLVQSHLVLPRVWELVSAYQKSCGGAITTAHTAIMEKFSSRIVIDISQ